MAWGPAHFFPAPAAMLRRHAKRDKGCFGKNMPVPVVQAVNGHAPICSPLGQRICAAVSWERQASTIRKIPAQSQRGRPQQSTSRQRLRTLPRILGLRRAMAVSRPPTAKPKARRLRKSRPAGRRVTVHGLGTGSFFSHRPAVLRRHARRNRLCFGKNGPAPVVQAVNGCRVTRY